MSLSPKADPSVKVKCRECGFEHHSLYKHLADEHKLSAEDYISKHPGAELLSPLGKQVYESQVVNRPDLVLNYAEHPYPSMETFGIGFNKASGYTDSKPIRGYKGFTKDHGVPEIDPHYVFPGEVSRDILLGMMKGGKIYTRGPTGSGKTTWFEQFAARVGRPFFRLQFHQEMEPIEMSGIWTVNETGSMEYLYSGLAQAMRLPCIIVFDEYDSGNPAVTAIANAILEGKPLVLGNKGGEKIVPHPDCLIVATGNTNGMGDDTGLYASTTVQSFATMNRFKMFVVIDYMGAADEVKVLTRKFATMPAKIAEDMVKLAGLIRDGFVGGKISAVLSTRQLVNWAEWVTATGEVRRSFNLAFWSQLGGVDQKVCDELFQRVHGAVK